MHSEGFEPSTLGAEIRYSIQLNYECVVLGHKINDFLYKNKSTPNPETASRSAGRFRYRGASRALGI